jgi:hypothetical protein
MQQSTQRSSLVHFTLEGPLLGRNSLRCCVPVQSSSAQTWCNRQRCSVMRSGDGTCSHLAARGGGQNHEGKTHHENDSDFH